MYGNHMIESTPGQSFFEGRTNEIFEPEPLELCDDCKWPVNECKCSETDEEDRSIIDFIYLKYKNIYGFPQGYCGQLAEEIQSKIGGVIVAGYLAFKSHYREHWWLERNGVIIDPMSDDLMKTDQHRHIKIHSDISKKYW